MTITKWEAKFCTTIAICKELASYGKAASLTLKSWNLARCLKLLGSISFQLIAPLHFGTS